MEQLLFLDTIDGHEIRVVQDIVLDGNTFHPGLVSATIDGWPLYRDGSGLVSIWQACVLGQDGPTYA